MGFDWSGFAAAGLGAGSGIWEGWRNREFQREINEQNEGLMREAWAREDNAVQRQAADMEAAGLSKTLAAGGGAAAGSPIKLDSLEASHNVAGQAFAAMAAQKSIAQTAAQTELTKAQADRERANAKLTNIEADRVLGTAGYYRESGNAYDGSAKYKSVATDTIKAAMAIEARARNIKATTTMSSEDFLASHKEEYIELEHKARLEKWTQEQVKTETMKLTRDILRKEKGWYTPKAVSGMIGNVTGAARNVQGYIPWIAK